MSVIFSYSYTQSTGKYQSNINILFFITNGLRGFTWTCLRIVVSDGSVKNFILVTWRHAGLRGPQARVVVIMFDFHRRDRGLNPGRGGKIS